MAAYWSKILSARIVTILFILKVGYSKLQSFFENEKTQPVNKYVHED